VTDASGAAGEIRVLLVDDDALVRAGLSMMLNGAGDLVIVGEAGDGDQVPAAVAKHRPDVVLMDLRMPRVDGITATRRLRSVPSSAPPPEVIVLTTFDADENVLGALRAGASGFLLKDAPPAEIADAIRRVAAGDPILSPAVTRRLMLRAVVQENTRERALRQLAGLSPREREVVQAIAEGRANAEIAASLLMSVPTVKAHVTHILTKAGLANRTQIALLAHDAGLALLAYAAVYAFAEEVGVAVVARVFLDHVHEEFPERDRLALGVLAYEVEVVFIDELIGERRLLAPGRPRLLDDRRVGDGAVEVAVWVVQRLVTVALGVVGEADPEPLPLHLGHVPDQAEQGHRGRLHRAAGHLLDVQVGALQLQGEPLGAEELGQGRPLASQPRSANARVVHGIDEQVGPVLRRSHPARLSPRRPVRESWVVRQSGPTPRKADRAAVDDADGLDRVGAVTSATSRAFSVALGAFVIYKETHAD
jgi:DNA-binding NarL/FixJ family response regulator